MFNLVMLDCNTIRKIEVLIIVGFIHILFVMIIDMQNYKTQITFTESGQ